MNISIGERLKAAQNKLVREFDISKTDYDDTITLYHGTTSKYLKDILKNGLRPRKETGVSNYENVAPSNDNLVYLTNLWHYHYASNALIINYLEYCKENQAFKKSVETKPQYISSYELYYSETGDVPIVLELEVPKAWLTFDEDIEYFRQFKKDVTELNITDFGKISFDYSLKQYTCASLCTIPVSMIKDIKVVAYSDLEYIYSEGSYAQLYSFWSKGFQVDEERAKEELAELEAYIEDWHLGALDNINPSLFKEGSKIEYEDSAVLVYY